MTKYLNTHNNKLTMSYVIATGHYIPPKLNEELTSYRYFFLFFLSLINVPTPKPNFNKST